MLKFFINDKQVELSDDISITFSYRNVDTETPTAERNSFSKSVDIPGTPNNNKIFGEAFDLSRNILDGGGTGVYFDARKRVDFTLYDNADIVESGYICLDNIINENGRITYSLTLYGGLGDFFYNLMYDENGEERNLSDLSYGFKDVDEENYLCYWDKDFIKQSWDSLKAGVRDNTVSSNITAVPTYSGNYDDFDNDKVLLNYDTIRLHMPLSHDLLPSFNQGYGSRDGWVICSASRDLDEWEVRDLRSIYQRPAIKASLLFDTISDPDKNGGYEVVWDNEILQSPYYKDSWIMFDRLDFDEDEGANEVRELFVTGTNIDTQNTVEHVSNTLIVDKNNHEISTFDFSSYSHPRIELNPINRLEILYKGKSNRLYSVGCFKKNILNSEGNKYEAYNSAVFGGYLLRIDCYVNGVYWNSSSNYFVYTDTFQYDYGSKESKAFVDNGFDNICKYHGLDRDNTVFIKRNQFARNNDNTFGEYPSRYSGWKEPINMTMDCPSENNVSFRLHLQYLSVDYDPVYGERKSSHFLFDAQSDRQINVVGANTWVSFMGNDEDETIVNGVYDGTINPSVQKTVVTKQMLFGNTSSPYDYLIGFTKMIGAKYRYERGSKKIFIDLRKNYFVPQGYLFDQAIDRGQAISIKPTLTEYKWYDYGFEQPETYASKLYDRKNKIPYGKHRVDTGYYFNNDVNNLYEDVIYTSAIPYLHNSIYFNEITDGPDFIPNVLLSPTYEITYWKEADNEEQNDVVYGYNKSSVLKNAKDSFDKLCCFDDDDSNVGDITDCFVFLNGFNGCPTTQLSDNIKIMDELNGNPCHMFCLGGRGYENTQAQDKTVVCYELHELPHFSKYLTNSNGVYTDSLDFKKPNSTFISNFEKYGDNITIYDRYWKNYIEDCYDKNSRSVTLKCFLNDMPKDAMRKFYYFDNSVWVINEITDFDAATEKSVQVTFVKVKDPKNYTEKDVEWQKPKYQ